MGNRLTGELAESNQYKGNSILFNRALAGKNYIRKHAPQSA